MTVLTRYGVLKALEKLQYPSLAEFLRDVYGNATAYTVLGLNATIERPDGSHPVQIADLRLIDMLTAKIDTRITIIQSLEYFEMILAAIPVSARVEINRSIAELDRRRFLAS